MGSRKENRGSQRTFLSESKRVPGNKLDGLRNLRMLNW
jgi:hypothetical protein